MKLLITGANGQVGKSLLDEVKNDHNVLALGRDELDISDRNAVNKIVAEFMPDIIVNAAAYTAVDRAEEDEESAYAVNAEGPSNLAKAAKSSTAMLVHISTDYVFDGTSEQPYTEDAPTNPMSIYGKSKLLGEKLVAEECDDFVIIRTSWVFSEYGNNFVKTMLKLADKHRTLNIVDDQVGGPTYARDIAKAILSIVVKRQENSGTSIPQGIYNFSGQPSVSWLEFAKAVFDRASTAGIVKETPLLTGISTVAYNAPAYRPANSRLDCEKISRDFGIDQPDWQNAILELSKFETN
ncbi:dTDP-4-dehydrorhamnose reductase [Vibrio vulnificus]|uniref:dTDP-4-dehydrorhamnose reductase n=1 Tax=Vibrio vulnificus TaxID=672 RepID=UPI0040597639